MSASFEPGRARCALTGRLLHHRDQAAWLPVLATDRLRPFASPESRWVERAAWQRWAERERWALEAAAALVTRRAAGPGEARVVGPGLVRTSASGEVGLVDLIHLVGLSAPAERLGPIGVALDAALGGGEAEVDVGEARWRLRGDGLWTAWQGDALVEQAVVPVARMAAWRRALCGPRPIGGAHVTFEGEGTRHRVLVRGAPALPVRALVGRVAEVLEQDWRRQGHDARRLDVLGGTASAEGLELWLAGDAASWRALILGGLKVRALGELGDARVHVRSAPVVSLGRLRRDGGELPFAVRTTGGPAARIHVRGEVTDRLDGLLAQLEAIEGPGVAPSASVRPIDF